MQREHHQALTKHYVSPVGKVLDELVQNKIRDHEMREYIRHHHTRNRRTRALLEILPRRGPEAFHAFCCALLSLKKEDLVKALTNPDTEDMDMCFPKQSSFHLGGNLYLIAEQDGILLTDKNTTSDISFPSVRWVQLQTTWGYIDDAVHYLENNRYTSLYVHLGANVFVTVESPALHLDIRHYYWMNDKRHPSSHGVSLDFEQYQKLKEVDRVLPDIVPGPLPVTSLPVAPPEIRLCPS